MTVTTQLKFLARIGSPQITLRIDLGEDALKVFYSHDRVHVRLDALNHLFYVWGGSGLIRRVEE